MRYRSIVLLVTTLGCTSASEGTAADSGIDSPAHTADDASATPPVDAGAGGLDATPGGDAGETITPPVLGDELVINGGFENGMSGWVNYGNTNIVASAHSGASAVRTGVAAGGFTQIINVAPGQRYRLAAYHKAEPGNGGAALRVNVDDPDAGAQSYAIGLFSTTYQRLTTDFVVPAGVTKVSVALWMNAGSGHTYLDDVSLRSVIPSTPVPLLVDEGDSISANGTHSTLYASGTADLSYFDHAVGGSGLNNVEARKQAVLDRKPATGRWVVTFLIGANDLAGNDPTAYANKLFAYSDELRAAGAKVALGTVLPQALANSVTHNSKRAVLNDIIRNNVGVHIDAVIDYAADPMIGPDSAAANLTYYSDGLHPTWGAGGGQERMFVVYKPVVDKLLMKDP